MPERIVGIEHPFHQFCAPDFHAKQMVTLVLIDEDNRIRRLTAYIDTTGQFYTVKSGPASV